MEYGREQVQVGAGQVQVGTGQVQVGTGQVRAGTGQERRTSQLPKISRFSFFAANRVVFRIRGSFAAHLRGTSRDEQRAAMPVS